MVRHAQASFGEENYDRLSPLGIRQAQVLGQYLAHLGIKFHTVYSGSMKRQIDTAQAVMAELSEDGPDSQVRIAEEFNEFDSYSIIMSQVRDMILDDPSVDKDFSRIYTDRRSFQHLFDKAMQRWISGEGGASGVEALHSFTNRVRLGVARVMEENGRKKRVAVFTSGGAICAVMQMALDLSAAKTMQLAWQIRNTSVSTFSYGDGSLSLYSFNSVAHLERKNAPELLTYL